MPKMRSTSSDTGSIDSEWDRVSQNPDNMMVSDSLRSILGDILSKPDNTPPSRPIASLMGGNRSIQVSVSRIERSHTGCLISGTVSAQDGLSIIQSDSVSWRTLSVSSEQGGEVFTQVLGLEWNLKVAVDFTDLADVCIVTVSFERASAQAPHP